MSSTTNKASAVTTPPLPPTSTNNKPYDHNGTDIKSVLLNISSIVFFFFPFFAFFVSQYDGISIENKNKLFGSSIVSTFAIYLLAYIAPPMGWRRPHPYSDDPTNVPFTFDKDK